MCVKIDLTKHTTDYVEEAIFLTSTWCYSPTFAFYDEDDNDVDRKIDHINLNKSNDSLTEVIVPKRNFKIQKYRLFQIKKLIKEKGQNTVMTM